MDVYTLTLTFSETVKKSTLNPAQFTLSNLAAAATDSFQLTGGAVSTADTHEDSTVVTITLSTDDANTLKEKTTLAVTAADTFITFTADAVRDMAKVAPKQIEALTTGLQAAVVQGDVTDPTLTGHDLNMNTGVLRLTFSETMLASSLAPTAFTLHSAPSGTATAVPLTAGVVSTTNSKILTITLDAVDMNNLKFDTTLAVDEASSVVSVALGGVTDMAGAGGNALVAVAATDNLLANAFVPDSTKPELASFKLDMNAQVRRFRSVRRPHTLCTGSVAHTTSLLLCRICC
jgi:hypothetical protein